MKKKKRKPHIELAWGVLREWKFSQPSIRPEIHHARSIARRVAKNLKHVVRSRVIRIRITEIE